MYDLAHVAEWDPYSLCSYDLLLYAHVSWVGALAVQTLHSAQAVTHNGMGGTKRSMYIHTSYTHILICLRCLKHLRTARRIKSSKKVTNCTVHAEEVGCSSRAICRQLYYIFHTLQLISHHKRVLGCFIAVVHSPRDLCIPMSIYLSIYLPNYLPIYLSIYLSIYQIFMSVCQCIVFPREGR